MNNWVTELPGVIDLAISQGGGVIVVETEAQCDLGKRALGRMAPGATGITFRADPSGVTPRLEA